MQNRSAESEKQRIATLNKCNIVKALPGWDKKLKVLILFEDNKLDALPTYQHSLCGWKHRQKFESKERTDPRWIVRHSTLDEVWAMKIRNENTVFDYSKYTSIIARIEEGFTTPL